MINEASLDKLRKDIEADIQSNVKAIVKSGIDDVLVVVRELAQFTIDGFERLENRMDGLEGRIGKLEAHAETVDITLRDHTARFIEIQKSLDEIAAKQDAQHNDIIEIYSILKKHEKQQKLSDLELKDAQVRINRIITWAQTAAKTLDIPLNLE